MVCQSGDSPTVEYKFGNGSLRRYKTELAPIEVQSKLAPVEGSNNFSNDGFEFSFVPGGSGGVRSTGIIRDYRLFESIAARVNFGENFSGIEFIGCGQTRFGNTTSCDVTSFIINTSKKCPSPQIQRCSIEIKHKGIIIFQDQGDCPCIFQIQCGKCPEGSIECSKPTYPGYCCLSCSEIKSEIKSMTLALRSKNRG